MKRLLFLSAAALAMTLGGAAAASADPYDHDGWSSHRDHDRGEHRGWDRGEHRGWDRDHDGWRRHERREHEWRSYGYIQPYSYDYSYPSYDYGYSYSYPSNDYSYGYPY